MSSIQNMNAARPEFNAVKPARNVGRWLLANAAAAIAAVTASLLVVFFSTSPFGLKLTIAAALSAIAAFIVTAVISPRPRRAVGYLLFALFALLWSALATTLAVGAALIYDLAHYHGQ